MYKHCTVALRATVQLFRFTLFAFFCSLFLLGCDQQSTDVNPPELQTSTGQVMGTWYSVKYLSPVTTDPALPGEEINKQIHARLTQVDRLMSTYKPESEISRFNRTPVNEWFPVSLDTFAVVSLAQRISKSTLGAFDITVAPLVDLWGFGPKYQENVLPEQSNISALLAEVGYQNLELNSETSQLRKLTDLHVDLSAIAKGYGVDQVADYLDEVGVPSYMVEVGGEIRTRGTKPGNKPWRIAIESPDSEQRDVHRILDITDRAVATSGDYRNYFEKDGQRYSHTIDPQTGYPVTHTLASVTVLGESAAEVDALATAFSVMGSDEAMQYAKSYNVGVYLIVKEKEGFVVQASEAFNTMTQKEL